jgi:sn-1 stearoyl-lipid 9-desaturase
MNSSANSGRGFLNTFIASYIWHMMGVTIGYHRLLSHRSFKCPKLVEYFWVFGGYLAFEGSPIWWATIHRAHHRYTDLPLDPHSPRYGWLNAYFGWVLHRKYPEHINPETQSRDLLKDPLYRFLEQDGDWVRAYALAALLGISFRTLLAMRFGWMTAVASFASALTVQQIPLLLNVVCHQPKLGYKTYDTGDDSVNVWWVALLTAGEGWHNNHHAFPGSARSGFKPFELDASWMMLRLLKAVGLVDWMNEPSAQSTFYQDSDQSAELTWTSLA